MLCAGECHLLLFKREQRKLQEGLEYEGCVCHLHRGLEPFQQRRFLLETLGRMHPRLLVGLKNYRVPGVVLKVLCILFKDRSNSPWQVLLIASLYR